MGICLNMIVRNEAVNLPRLFASLEGHVDYYVISDTGSTDGTPELIRKLGNQHGISGTVTSHPWVDFAANRNLALQDAVAARCEGLHDCSWLMIIDADEELVIRDPDWRMVLREGVTYTAMSGGQRISVVRVFLLWMSGQSWCWKGKVHNHVDTISGSYSQAHLPEVVIRMHLFQGGKSQGYRNGAAKARADADIMAEELLGIPPTKDNAHRFFQWAHVLQLSGEVRKAAAIFSELATENTSGKGLRYISAVLAGRCHISAGGDVAIGRQWFELARSIDPGRREAHYYQALLTAENDPCKGLSQLQQAAELTLPDGPVFYLEQDIYEWRTSFQQVLFLHRSGYRDAAVSKACHLLSEEQIPEPERGFLQAFLAHDQALSSHDGPIHPSLREDQKLSQHG